MNIYIAFQVTHHVTERRTSLLPPLRTSSLSDTTSSTGLLTDSEGSAVRSRRDRSRETPWNSSRVSGPRLFSSRDKSRDGRYRDKSKDGRYRDKSKESKLRLKVRERSKERSSFDATKSSSLVVRGFIETKNSTKNNVEKGKSTGDNFRKVSKQNTYIFQNGRNYKYSKQVNSDTNNKEDLDTTSPPVPQHSLSYRLQQSLDNQDYSLVLDDIRETYKARGIISKEQLVKEDEEESQYAEICETILPSNSSAPTDPDLMQSTSSSSNSRHSERNSRKDKFLSSNWSFGSGLSIGSEDSSHQHSFTLLRQDVSQLSFLRGGFSAGDIRPMRNFLIPFKNSFRPMSPASSQC